MKELRFFLPVSNFVLAGLLSAQLARRVPCEWV